MISACIKILIKYKFLIFQSCLFGNTYFFLIFWGVRSVLANKPIIFRWSFGNSLIMISHLLLRSIALPQRSFCINLLTLIIRWITWWNFWNMPRSMFLPYWFTWYLNTTIHKFDENKTVFPSFQQVCGGMCIINLISFCFSKRDFRMKPVFSASRQTAPNCH